MSASKDHEISVQLIEIVPSADDPALKLMRERAARANIDAALLVLDTLVPDVPPDPGDELPE